jgi:non-heme chloroperoxidase
MPERRRLSEHDGAHASGVFPRGLCLLPSCWDRWATVLEEAGYPALTPGWPDDPETVEDAKAHPEVFAGKSRLSGIPSAGCSP